MAGARTLKTKRTTVKRRAQRGAYDFDTVAAILDATFLCHVGFAVDGQPYVIPTSYGRHGKVLYVHGSAASRMLRTLAEGVPVCLTVMLLDGLVLARSAFNHSINYRSVVVLGTATLVEGQEKDHALRVISDHIIPGRWSEVRGPSAKELKATSVLRLDVEEASAKIRTGPPHDDEEDIAWPCWAGVLPFATSTGTPVPDGHVPDGQAPSACVAEYRRFGEA